MALVTGVLTVGFPYWGLIKPLFLRWGTLGGGWLTSHNETRSCWTGWRSLLDLYLPNLCLGKRAKVRKSSKKYYSNDAVCFSWFLPWYIEKFSQRLPANEIQDSFFHREIGAWEHLAVVTRCSNAGTWQTRKQLFNSQPTSLLNI